MMSVTTSSLRHAITVAIFAVASSNCTAMDLYDGSHRQQRRPELQAMEQELQDMRAELQEHHALLWGTAPIPFLWAKQMKLGMNSISISNDTIDLGDAGTNPVAAGTLQRNNMSLVYRGSIQPGDDPGVCTAAHQGALRWSSSTLELCTVAGWVTVPVN
jgi:hypothetical protein